MWTSAQAQNVTPFSYTYDDLQDQQPTHYSTTPIMAGPLRFTAPCEACDACDFNAGAGLVVTGSTPITPMLRDWLSVGGLLGLLAAGVVQSIENSVLSLRCGLED